MKLRRSVYSSGSSVDMGEVDDERYSGTDEEDSLRSRNLHKVSITPLVFLIFYEVSGGPFGIEDSVQAAGPLLAILGFLLFPLIWSIPEALITAELGTMFPENGGYVVWVSSALGPFWGFQQGWMKWLSGVIDNALYPVLFLDYLKSGIPSLQGGAIRTSAVLILTVGLTYLNYRVSTLTGEVHDPKKTLPKALLYALTLVVTAYLYPLLTGIGAIPLERELWCDGYFSDVAKVLGGVWLRWWLQAGSALSNMGMFVAEMSSDSYQLLGMADRGMLPEFFGRRSRHGTPLVGILFSASGVLLLSWMSFQEIVAAENFLYCFGMILGETVKSYSIAGSRMERFLATILLLFLIALDNHLGGYQQILLQASNRRKAVMTTLAPNSSANDENANDHGQCPLRNAAEKGMQASNLYLAKAWFNSTQPMTRSRSSELRRRYAAMQCSQMTTIPQAPHNAPVPDINKMKQEFPNTNNFYDVTMNEVSNQMHSFMSPSNSSTSFNAPPVATVDTVSSVVNMLKGTLERKKLNNKEEKEMTEGSPYGIFSSQEAAPNICSSQAPSNQANGASNSFHMTPLVQVKGPGSMARVGKSLELSMDHFPAHAKQTHLGTFSGTFSK
ncbi:hypothetical protein HPP92_002457 [Vanilla planifolia]|uniref:Uncharacterized protein n=1 Tax=Vanilla planifolia TaxID=51239 RepID=A0A835RT22_VANPL|nr:hypothetical protein HPP92_002457 [Vanilla planifolia]